MFCFFCFLQLNSLHYTGNELSENAGRFRMESGEIGVQPSMLQVEGLKLGNYVIEQSLLFRCHTGIWKVNVNVDVMLVIPWMMELCIQTSHKFDVMHASWFMINQSYSKCTVLISCDLIHWLPYHWDMANKNTQISHLLWYDSMAIIRLVWSKHG